MEVEEQDEAFFEEGDEDEGEECEDATEDHDLMLLLEGQFNPLDFLEDGTDDAPVDANFSHERANYEALAEKKRKRVLDANDLDDSVKELSIEDVLASGGMDEFWELIGGPKRKRRSKKAKKRGRPKGIKNRISPLITKKLGDATLHYACGEYDKAIRLSNEVVMAAPCTAEAFHTLGLVYDALGDKKKSFNFYFLAASLTLKDSSLWKRLVTWSTQEGNAAVAMHCISKAITADPQDVSLRFDRAAMYVDLKCCKKAAISYHQILQSDPANEEACKMAALLFYHKCDQADRAVTILEDFVKHYQSTGSIPSLLNLLLSIYLENKQYSKALELLQQLRANLFADEEFPLHLSVKSGICEAYLGNMDIAENLFLGLKKELAEECGELIEEVADSMMKLGHFEAALRFFCMLEGSSRHENGSLHFRIAQCYAALDDREKAISSFYKVLSMMESVGARLALASILVEDGKDDDAIFILSASEDNSSTADTNDAGHDPWWLNGRVRLKLARIYQKKQMIKPFVDTILPCVLETLFIENINQKIRPKKKLGRKVLQERIKILNNLSDDSVFQGFRPVATQSDLRKASRAKKMLQKIETRNQERKAAALAAGMDWQSDDSDDELLRRKSSSGEPPLPELLKDNEHYQLIVDLCKALASLQRYWEALQVINHALSLASITLSNDRKEELRSLAAQIAYNMSDPSNGYDYVKYIVRQHPYSLAAWNCYYKVVSKLVNRFSKQGKLWHGSVRSKTHVADEPPTNTTENDNLDFPLPELAANKFLGNSKVQQDSYQNDAKILELGKFLRGIRAKHADCVPPIIISGHQLLTINQHQAAAKEYLEAYKIQPDNPFISLCVGTALINLALGFRLQNKHQTVTQGLAFLYNCLRLCPNSQEALYNIARAYQQVGLVTLAVLYYEKVLAIQQKDYPIPRLPNDNHAFGESKKPGYCSLHMEAAFNLHLIYKKSGAHDLARQILKDYCRP